jgi:hypothetical protein
MAYNYNNFLRPLSTTDRNIQILDSNGKIKYTVNPFAVINTMVNNNVIKINLKNDKIIILDFFTSEQAKDAILQLQIQIDTLIGKTPLQIDKQIENYVLAQEGIINEITPEGGTLTINGTVSVNSIDTNSINVDSITTKNIYPVGNTISFHGDLIPGTNSVYNLGSPSNQWHSLYVGTSSIYIGGVTLSSHGDSILVNSINLGSRERPVIMKNDGGQMIYDGSPMVKYFATSSTSLQLPDLGHSITLQTQRNLAYNPMQQVVVYNTVYNSYMADDYVEDDSAFFTGQVNGYVSGATSATIDIVVDYSSGYGVTNSQGIVPTYSFWYIDLAPANYSAITSLTITDPLLNGLVLSDGTDNNLNVTNDLTYDGLTFSVNASIKLLGQTQFQQTVEVVNSSTASATIDYDFNLGSIWYHNDLISDYNANFINVPESRGVITTTIVISQGATAYSPTSLTINGATHSIKWSNATPPTGTPNQTDIVGLSFISTNSSFVEILGNISTFG